jgi:hypothetical protein
MSGISVVAGDDAGEDERHPNDSVAGAEPYPGGAERVKMLPPPQIT